VLLYIYDDFSTRFCVFKLRVYAKQMDEQTDERTNKNCNAAYQLAASVASWQGGQGKIAPLNFWQSKNYRKMSSLSGNTYPKMQHLGLKSPYCGKSWGKN